MPHSRSKCMECSQPPTHECLWAEGRGRAWFCDKHWKEWSKEHAGDIVAEHELKNGEVGAKYNQEPKSKKKADNHDGKKTGNGTEVGFFIPLSSELAEQFPSLGDKDQSPPHITFLYVGEVPKEKEELFLATCFKVFEAVSSSVRSHLEGLDYFENPAGEGRIAIVRHRFDHDMSDARWRLRNALQEAGFTVDDSFPLVYHPHTTLGYLSGLEATYQGDVPEGAFEFNGVEVWGLSKVYQIPFGRGFQRIARDTQDFRRVKNLMDAFVKHLDNLKEPGEAEALAKSADALQKALVFTIENPEHRKVFEERMRPQIESFRGFLRELAHFSDASDIARFLIRVGGLGAIGALLSNLRGILDLIRTNDTDSEFHLAVGPWHVNFLSAPGQDWTKARIKKIVDVLQEATKRISGAGLGKVLGGLVNAYPTKELPPSAVGAASAGAAYNPPSDSLNLSAQISGGDLQTIYVIAHELGHRYYFRVLGSQGRASWEDFFESNKGTPPSLDKIISDWEKFIVSGPGNSEEKQDAAYYLKFLAKKSKEDAHWLILAFNMLAESGDKTYPTLNLLKYRKPDIKMFLHPVTSYSLTNAGELFAETFAHYIINGPRRLPELLRYNFVQAVPQARLASLINRVACRYIVRCADRVGKTFTLNPGDPVLYGKYKNKPGTLSQDDFSSTIHKGGARCQHAQLKDARELFWLGVGVPDITMPGIDVGTRKVHLSKELNPGVLVKCLDAQRLPLNMGSVPHIMLNSVETPVWGHMPALGDVLSVNAPNPTSAVDSVKTTIIGGNATETQLKQYASIRVPVVSIGGVTGSFIETENVFWNTDTSWNKHLGGNFYLMRPSTISMDANSITGKKILNCGHQAIIQDNGLLIKCAGLSISYPSTETLCQKIAQKWIQSKTFTLNIGDPILYGKYKNKPGKIKGFSVDEKSGDPVVIVEPYPAGRKQDKDIKLFKIRQDDKPRDEVSRVAARYQEKKTVKTKDGEDATVYVYSERQIANRNKAKADRVEKLRKNLDKLRSQVKKDIKSEDPKTWLTALVVGLINDTYERVGNDESAKDGHVGVTGWTPEHVKFSGGKATFTYTGKSGVDHVKETKDADLVHALKEAVKDKKKGDTLFTYEGGRVTAETVNEYLKPFDITAKDIRGLHANREMKERLKAIRSKGGKLPTDKKEREKQLKGEFKEALEGAAEAVGHEPATLKSQYLVPGLEDDFMKDGTVTERMNKKAIIHIDNATDGLDPDDRDLRGQGGLLSSLTPYETALIQDMLIHPRHPILALCGDDGNACWYELRKHVIDPNAVKELLGAGYLQTDEEGNIELSDMLTSKIDLYRYDWAFPGLAIPDEMKIAAVRKMLATENPSIWAMRLLQVFAKGQGKTSSLNLELLKETLNVLGWQIETGTTARLLAEKETIIKETLKNWALQYHVTHISPGLTTSEPTEIFFSTEEEAEKAAKEFAIRPGKPPANPEVGKSFIEGIGEPQYASYRHEWFIEIFRWWLGVPSFTVITPHGKSPEFGMRVDWRGRIEKFDDMQVPAFWTWAYKNGLQQIAKQFLDSLGDETVIKEMSKTPSARSFEDTGTCPACFRNIKILKNRMMRHGWQVQGARSKGQYGGSWHQGACFGVGYEPFELSPKGTQDYIRRVLEPMAKTLEGKKQALIDRPAQIAHPWKHQVIMNKPADTASDIEKYSYEEALRIAIAQVTREQAYLKEETDRLQESVAHWQKTPLPGERIHNRGKTASREHQCPSEARGHYRHTCPRCGNVEKCRCRSHEGIPVCVATILCYDCEEEIRTGTPRVDELELYKMMSVQATKSHAEKEDEVIRDLSRKTPTKKPPRHDLRDEHADPEEKPSEFGAEGDRDLSLNYKRVAACWVARIAGHKPGDVWQTQKGWSAKNPKGESQSFKGDSAQDQAKAYAQGGAPEGGSEDTGEKKTTPDPKKDKKAPKPKPKIQEAKSPEEWVAQIPNKKIFDEVMKELTAFEAQVSGVSNSYELPPIPGVPEGLKTMGQVRELLSRKKELSALVEGKKPPKPKEPPKPKKPPKDPSSEGSKVPGISREMKRMFEDAGVSQETISSLQDLPNDQQAAILNAYIKAQDEINLDMEMLNEDTDQQFIKEVTQAYRTIRGGGADVKKTKGTDDSGYEDDEEDGDLFTFDRKTYTTKLSKSPEEIGRMLALSKAAPQLANPLRVGGKDVDDTPKTDAELTELTQQSYNRFKNLTPNLRAEAAVQMERALKALPKDSPKRDQLNRILDGMTLAAAINNENVAVKGKNLRPELAPSFRVLAKSLERQGRADILLGTVEHYESPESRKIIADALENLRGPEISEMLGGESGPWKGLLKDVDWDNTGDAGQEEIKQMLRRTALDEMTTLQALMETVADDQSADSPVTAEQVREHMEKWRGDKKVPREMQRALDDYAKSCSLGDPQGIKDCKEAANRVHEAHFSLYLKELKKLGVELKPGNPVLAQISDALRTGDFSKLDTKYVPAGAQDVTVGD